MAFADRIRFRARLTGPATPGAGDVLARARSRNQARISAQHPRQAVAHARVENIALKQVRAAVFTKAVELALFYNAKLDLKLAREP